MKSTRKKASRTKEKGPSLIQPSSKRISLEKGKKESNHRAE